MSGEQNNDETDEQLLQELQADEDGEERDGEERQHKGSHDDASNHSNDANKPRKSSNNEDDEDVIQQNEEDKRSVFVQNVEYSSTKEELIEIFKPCGEIVKVTIPQTRQGQGKGFAYVQFADPSAVELAKSVSDFIHRGRALKVLPKRTNQHGFKKKGSFKPTTFNQPFPFMKNNNLMKSFMFGGNFGFKKKFNPH